MVYQTGFRERFAVSPPVIRWLVKSIGFAGIGIAVLSKTVGSLMGAWNPAHLLALSAAGIKKHFFWQWLTYFLVLPGGFAFGSLLSLVFTLFLVWTAGTALVERVGTRSFIKLLTTCILGGGLAGWLAMLGLPAGHGLAGATIVCYGLLVAWMMHAPSQRVTVLLLAQVQMRWLIAALLGFSLLGALGEEQYALAAAYGGSVLAAYVYGLLAWNVAGPFRFTRRLDEFIAQIGVRWRKWRHGTSSRTSGKVYDIKDAQILDKENAAQARRAKFHAWESNRD